MADAQLLFCRETLVGLRRALAAALEDAILLNERLAPDLELSQRAVMLADSLEMNLDVIARLRGRLPPSKDEVFRQMACRRDGLRPVSQEVASDPLGIMDPPGLGADVVHFRSTFAEPIARPRLVPPSGGDAA